MTGASPLSSLDMKIAADPGVGVVEGLLGAVHIEKTECDRRDAVGPPETERHLLLVPLGHRVYRGGSQGAGLGRSLRVSFAVDRHGGGDHHLLDTLPRGQNPLPQHRRAAAVGVAVVAHFVHRLPHPHYGGQMHDAVDIPQAKSDGFGVAHVAGYTLGDLGGEPGLGGGVDL